MSSMHPYLSCLVESVKTDIVNTESSLQYVYKLCMTLEFCRNSYSYSDTEKFCCLYIDFVLGFDISKQWTYSIDSFDASCLWNQPSTNRYPCNSISCWYFVFESCWPWLESSGEYHFQEWCLKHDPNPGIYNNGLVPIYNATVYVTSWILNHLHGSLRLLWHWLSFPIGKVHVFESHYIKDVKNGIHSFLENPWHCGDSAGKYTWSQKPHGSLAVSLSRLM